MTQWTLRASVHVGAIVEGLPDFFERDRVGTENRSGADADAPTPARARSPGWPAVSAGGAERSHAFAGVHGGCAGSLPTRLHDALEGHTLGGHPVEHISQNSTAVEAREESARKLATAPKPRRKSG